MKTSLTNAKGWPDRTELVPFLPLVAAVWSDGVLSDEERAALEDHVLASDAFDDDTRDALAPWIDPAHPPDTESLAALRRAIRRAEIEDDGESTASLTDLGLALWSTVGEIGPWHDDETVSRLRASEAAAGLLGRETARRLRGLGGPPVPPEDRPELDVDVLASWLMEDHRGIRSEVRALLTEPALMIPLELPKEEYRERVLDAVRALAENGVGSIAYPEAYGGRADRQGSVAAFETLALGDLSVLVKFGVQFGLFGGSVAQLGTDHHHETYLSDIGSLALPGSYAMTETGHGSNVRDLETTATYDETTHELVVHSPNEASGKDWIGNAACHAQLATVFARLIVAGEDHGVHAVLVPVRDADGRLLSGVRIEDRGLKLGLNGVDNGRIWFDQVRVPAANLLDRFASIDADGRYQSPIPSAGRRFFTMLGTLVAGRVSIASASVSAASVGLTIAVRYASGRRQFGPDGAAESPILHYTAVQRGLMPALARTYAGLFAVRDLQARFGAMTAPSNPEIEVRAAALKAWTSDHCVTTLQTSREMWGGLGYLAANRFAALKADTDIFTTFEGANLVLYQLAAKGLLSRYRDEMTSLDLRGALRYLGDRAESSLSELNPVAKRRTDTGHLDDPEMHLGAIRYREDRLLRSVASRIRGRLRDGMESFQAVNEVQDHLVALARAHAERIALESFHAAVDTCPAAVSESLTRVYTLFALVTLEADRGWFLEAGVFEPAKSRAIRGRINELCREVASVAPGLVDGFAIPEGLLPELVRNGSEVRPK
ncbi:MAG: acyl-CoA dehydrogenase [Gemmatimonadota bacterium]